MKHSLSPSSFYLLQSYSEVLDMRDGDEKRYAVMAELGNEPSIRLTLIGMPEVTTGTKSEPELRATAVRKAINQSPHSFTDLGDHDVFVYPVGDISVISVHSMIDDEVVQKSTDADVDNLLSKLPETEPDADTSFIDAIREAHGTGKDPQVMFDAVKRELPFDIEQSPLLSEEIIKENLEEVCLLLITTRESGTYGKQLIDDLWRLFEVQLSAGTVYPNLHELEEEDLLARQKTLQTKEYVIQDQDKVREHFERAANQHLALGLLLYVTATELES